MVIEVLFVIAVLVQMWREEVLAKQVGIKMIESFGDSFEVARIAAEKTNKVNLCQTK